MIKQRKFTFILPLILFIYCIIAFGHLIYDLYSTVKIIDDLNEQVKEVKYQNEQLYIEIGRLNQLLEEKEKNN